MSTRLQTSPEISPSERPDEPAVGTSNLGADIRALRKSRGLTLFEMAQKLERSIGFISQLERGLSQPAMSDLRTIADIFDVPVSLFFGEQTTQSNESGYVVRAGSRRKLGEDSVLVEELLSPDLGGSFEIIRSIFAPNAIRTKAITRQTEEAGYVISGRLQLEIDGTWFDLGPGDSFRYGALPVRWENKGKEKAVAIWVISPPVY